MALAVTWSGYADTDLDISSFFANDHTVCVRFLPQYPNAYLGPMISVNGAGRYVLGQGDFRTEGVAKVVDPSVLGASNVVLQVGPAPAGIISIVQPTPDRWHHLAAVRRDNRFALYLDGEPIGEIDAPTLDLPSGKIRFGKTASGTDGGADQFYGLLDDAAFFSAALSANDLQQLMSRRLTGEEPHLIVGYTFVDPDSALPPSLSRPLAMMTTGTWNVPATHDSSDTQSLPLSLVSTMHVPFPPGVPVQVVQGFDNAYGSHNGFASFCLDLILAGKPQSESFNKPFYAAAAGTVDWVIQDKYSFGDSHHDSTSDPNNFMGILQAPGETCDYMHLNTNTAVVTSGEHVSDCQHLANMSDVGAPAGNYHLHIALGNVPDGDRADGEFVTIPLAFNDYYASDDGGVSWQHVDRGVPRAPQWIQRAPLFVAPINVHYKVHPYDINVLAVLALFRIAIKSVYGFVVNALRSLRGR